MSFINNQSFPIRYEGTINVQLNHRIIIAIIVALIGLNVEFIILQEKTCMAENQNQRSGSVDQVVLEESNPITFIGQYHQAPLFMKDNEQIQQGYRINFNSIRKLLKSLFMIHNQSVNIWSHFLTFLVFICLFAYLYTVIDEHQFKKTLIDYRNDLEQTFRDYQASIKNLTSKQSIDMYSQQARAEMSMIKSNIINKFQSFINKIDEKSTEINELLDENIQGIKDTFKEQLKKSMNQVQKYIKNYQINIAPVIVERIQDHLHSDLLEKIKIQAEELKMHVDSGIFKSMELHPQAPNPMLISRWPIFIFLATAILCLLFSTIFHLFHPLSSKTYGLLLRFDFAGISLLIAGSAFPPFYYGMYCHFAVAQIYLTCTVIAALFCFVIGLFQWIHTKGNQRYRSIIFGGYGLLMFIPLTHLVINQFVFDNYGDPFRFSSSYIYYIMLASFYCTGLYIFSVRCPERNNPGKYDICGHSHQIWHFLVVAGIISTYFGALQNFQMRKQSVCPS